MFFAASNTTRQNYQQWVVLFIVFLSRIPFLNNGYGSEEDAWGLAVVARRMGIQGGYEASRLPGHPLQEYIYSIIWNSGAFYFNILTAIFSVVSVGFFIQTLKKISPNNSISAAIALAFTPVIYIASTNALDYMWALAFIMISFYFLISDKAILSGIFLGLAVGCRITSAAFFIPYAFWFFEKHNLKHSLNKVSKLSVAFILITGILFLPVISKYGTHFFDYIEKFPDQPISKIIYKGTFGVWGLLGFIDLITIIFILLFSRKILTIVRQEVDEKKRKIVVFCLITLFINSIIYMILPQKSSYLIPLIPFVIILIATYFDKTVMMAFSVSLILSCFTFGINLNDDLRGSQPSAASFDVSISGQVITMDVLRGPLKADYLKRKNKMEFAEETILKIKSIKQKTVIIAGFWANDILANMPVPPNAVRLIYYADESELKKYAAEGYKIFYLQQQDFFNDECYKKIFTKEFASPL